MRILITGKGGKSGSWAIRGCQLGEAIGATVQPLASAGDIETAGLVVVVKRTPLELIERIRAAGKRWVFDMVDCWPQPAGNAWNEDQAAKWLRRQLGDLRPDAVVFPTETMLADSAWSGPAIVLPHHAWPKYLPDVFHAKVRRVGFEGGEQYLGKWRKVIEDQCKRRGWEFVINGDLASCQIGIALRDTPGYPAPAWKANTKLANLQALGIPALCSPERGYFETRSGAERWAENRHDVERCFDAWAYIGARKLAREAMLLAVPTLEKIAGRYRTWLHQLSF